MLDLFSEAGALARSSLHFVSAAGLLASGGALLHTRRQRSRMAAVQHGERNLRKEILSYLLFQNAARSMAPAELSRDLCRLIAARSSFARAALLLRDADGALCVIGSAGFDDLSVEALNRWGAAVSAKGAPVAQLIAAHRRVGGSSFTMQLERRSAERNALSQMLCGRVHVIPFRTGSSLPGSLVVSADHLRSGKERSDVVDPTRSKSRTAVLPLSDLLEPLEALALHLSMQFVSPEDVIAVKAVQAAQPSVRHSRSSRRRAAKPAEGGNRRLLDETATPADTVETAAALEQIRKVIAPETQAPQRAGGVSGRPPRSIWRAESASNL